MLAEELPLRVPWRRNDIEQAFRLALAGVLAVWRLPDAVVVVGRPDIDAVEDKPHALDRPAVRWRSESLWMWQGIWIAPALAAGRRELSGRDVLAERNAERRRVMIDAIGIDRFLATTDALIVQQDDYGKLWRLGQAGQEPFVAVELVNATAEADGSHRHYFLRVSPTLRTAREAVAWTFGFDTAAAYNPRLQS